MKTGKRGDENGGCSVKCAEFHLEAASFELFLIRPLCRQ
jgi:hypothetical protein